MSAAPSLPSARVVDAPASWHAVLLYGCLAILPPMAFYLLPVSSQAVGFALALTAVALQLSWLTHRPQVWQMVLPVSVSLALLLHLMVAGQSQAVEVGRAAGSMVLIGAALFVAAQAGPAVFGALCRRHFQWMYGAFMVSGVLGALRLSPLTANSTSKPVFPFSEVSHYGLALCPLVLTLCVTAPTGLSRLAYLAGGLAVAATLQNLTLIAGMLLISAICLPMRWLLPVALLAAAGIGALLTLDATALLYYTERLDFSSESENLSALVVIQGWQMAAEAWDSTGGWGLGLQQLGVRGATADVSDFIAQINGGDYLNLFDGGFLLAKLLAELGIFGLTLAVLFTLAAVRYAWALRRVATGSGDLPAGRVFAMAVVVMYSLELFMRSPGYLTGSAALLLTALLYLSNNPAQSKPANQPLQ